MFPALAMVIYISDLLYLFSDMVWILRIRSVKKTPEKEQMVSMISITGGYEANAQPLKPPKIWR
jgi:hypothetical protein